MTCSQWVAGQFYTFSLKTRVLVVLILASPLGVVARAALLLARRVVVLLVRRVVVLLARRVVILLVRRVGILSGAYCGSPCTCVYGAPPSTRLRAISRGSRRSVKRRLAWRGLSISIPSLGHRRGREI